MEGKMLSQLAGKVKRYLQGQPISENDDWEFNSLGNVPQFENYESDDMLYQFV